MNDKTQGRGPIPGYVVAQYFGIFDGVNKDHYREIVATAPFERCNLLILAFVHAVKVGAFYFAQFTNGRDNHFPFDPSDPDTDRVKLVVQAARRRNPSLKILLSLGWDTNDIYNAATTPIQFASSAAQIAQDYGLDGFDIDYESIDQRMTPQMMQMLAQRLRAAFAQVTPQREMIFTITPAEWFALDGDVLAAFTYTMPQSYGGNGEFAKIFADMFGSYDRIVYGIDIEGYLDAMDPRLKPDDPRPNAELAKQNNAAGIFGWRLDNDNVARAVGLPTFKGATEMWALMHEPAVR